jgi:hypothetical protein
MEQTARFPKFFDYDYRGNRETLAGLSAVSGSTEFRFPETLRLFVSGGEARSCGTTPRYIPRRR